MTGHVYLERMMSALRCEYKSLEIGLDDVGGSGAAPKFKIPKHVSVNTVGGAGKESGTSSGDDQNSSSQQEKKNRKKLKTTKGSPQNTALTIALAAPTGSVAQSNQSVRPHSGPQSSSGYGQPSHQSGNSNQSQNQTSYSQNNSRQNSQQGNAAPRPPLQFGPNIRSTPMTYPAKPKGPRWACPVNGHTGHNIDQCTEFWGASSSERRELLKGTGCFTCLGREQGCGVGGCGILSEVPADVICQECVKTLRPGRIPPNILCCGLQFHKKPLIGDIIDVMQQWIPNFRAASLNVPVNVNCVQLHHSNALRKPKRACLEPDEHHLVFDTHTGSTRRVKESDRVVGTSPEAACYVMQTLNIAGERVLTFYDSGANNNIVEASLARKANFLLIGHNPVDFNVAGGGTVRSDAGQYSAILGPDVDGNHHDVECQAVDKITASFPAFPLQEVIKEARSVLGDGLKFPPEVGGDVVRLLIGIRSTQLSPILKITLPSGLCVYESKFKDIHGTTLCFGGPHPIFTSSYASAGHSSGMLQVLFTQIATAYMRSPRVFVGGFPQRCSGPIAFEEVEIVDDSPQRDCWVEPESVVIQETATPKERDEEDEHETFKCYHFEECASPDACYKALIPLAKLKGLIDQNDVPDVTDFRCDVCANCAVCKKSARERTKSLQEEFEQDVILKSVELDPENKRVLVELPFIKEPVEFLSKKHNGNSNRYQAMRVYKSQCRKPEQVKQKLRETMSDLMERGFMVKVTDLGQEQQDFISTAKFHHYFPWRAVYKEGSVSTPVRIVVDPSASGLNQILAKGENMLGRIPEILINFRSNPHAWCSDISKMYNMLKLKDQALPYSLFLYNNSLSEDQEPDVYCMQSAWYGVSSSGNQANVAIDMLWQKFGEELPEAVVPLGMDRYMDDVDSGASTREEADEQIKQVKECLSRGGFKPKFVAHTGEAPPDAASSDGRTVSVLGSVWETESDLISLGHRPMNLEKKVRGSKAPPKIDVTTPEGLRNAMSMNLVTRAAILSRVAEFYDPVGLFEPLKLAMKLALSELNALDWTDPIPQDRHEVWIKLFTAMEDSRDLKLPRCIKPHPLSDKARLLCLADAAEYAGGCAIYVGYPLSDGSYSCNLVYARSKLMRNTIPRNELEAILLAAEASLVVQKALKGNVSEVLYFSDSSIAVAWVLNTAKRLRMWTLNRVKEITTAIRWVVGNETTYPLYHIAGENNIADMVTRPVDLDLSEIGSGSAWQTGLLWMTAPSENLPKEQFSLPQQPEDIETFERETFPDQILYVQEREDREMLKDTVQVTDGKGVHIITGPHVRNVWLTKTVDFVGLGWDRALRKIIAILRFVERLKHRLHQRKRENREGCTGCMTDPEEGLLKMAYRVIFLAASEQAVSSEGKRRLNHEFHYDNGIWYSARRMEKEGMPELKDVDALPFFDALLIKKVLPIVHTESTIFKSYLSYVHCRVLDHPGVEQTLKGIRELMMPIGGSSRVKIMTFRRGCHKCRRRLKERIRMEVGDFPLVRSTVAPPFYHSMIDIATGFRAKATKNSKEYVPVYALVMVCVTTSATNILVMESMTTNAVLEALERHASRYGMPGELFVDSGTQLVNLQNAEFDLRSLDGARYRCMSFKITIANPKAHHEQGRVERKVKVLRDMLERLTDTDDTSRTVLEWESVFARIASQVDDLPIARGSATAATDLGWEIITPNRLKLGRNSHRNLEGPVVLDNNPATQLERNRLIFSKWYKLFLERLPLLIPVASKESGRDVKIGDVVLFIQEDSNIPGMETWKLAKVVEVLSARTVLLEYVNARGGRTVLQRSIRQVSLILGVEEIGPKPKPLVP